MDPDEEIKIGSPTRGISGLPPEGERVCDDEILLEGSKKNLGIENKKEKEKKKPEQTSMENSMQAPWLHIPTIGKTAVRERSQRSTLTLRMQARYTKVRSKVDTIEGH